MCIRDSCRSVPVFVSYRESSKSVAGTSQMYQVKTFSHGLHYEDIAALPVTGDVYDSTPLNALPEPVKSDILDLPAMETWMDIRDQGAAVSYTHLDVYKRQGLLGSR